MLPEPIQRAVMAVEHDLDESKAPDWFKFLLDTAESEQTWDTVFAKVRDQGAGIVGSSGVDEFKRVLEGESDPLGTVRELAKYSADELAAAFSEGLAQNQTIDGVDEGEDEEEEPAPALDEPGNWAGFVGKENGFWGGWDGENWPEWRTAFLDLARANGVGEDAEEQLDWLDKNEPTPADKMVYLKDTLKFAVSDSAIAQVKAGIPGPQGDWGSFVGRENGFWAGWDGENWPQWRTAFLSLGTAEDVADDAREQLDWLENSEPTLKDKLIYLRDTLGFSVDESLLDRELAADGEYEEDVESTPVLSQEKLAELAELQPQAEQAFVDAISSTLAPESAELFASEDMAELFARFPQAAELSAEEIAGLVQRATAG